MKLENKTFVINGSARANSNTAKLLHHLFGTDITMIELSHVKVGHYNYDGKYDADDYFQVVIPYLV